MPNESWATPAGQDDPNRSGGWNPATGQQDDDPGRAGGWRAAQEDNSGGWAVGAAAQQQNDQPAWGQQSEQAAPGWSPAEPTARAAAKVSVPGAVRPEGAWPAQEEQGRAGGWENGPAAGRDDDPDRSGGWAAGRSAGVAEAPQPSAWGAPEEQRPAGAWSGAASVPQQREPERAADEPGQPAWGAAAPTPAEAPARASASVPSPDSPPAWAGNQDDPGQWTRERPAAPEAEPWAPGEAWGRAAEAQPEQSASPGWEPARAEDGPMYQPAPGPGISPANAVPLPPQEQRVPGAALAAAPPADYAPFEPGDRNPQAYEPEQAADAGWGTPAPAHEEPQSPAGPVVPGPRTSPEAGAGGAVSASASVPTASRVTPPADQPLPTTGGPAPQPRVYGRPARPEPEEAPGQDGPHGFPEPGPQSRADESGRPHGFADAPPVHSAPPSSPSAPPPFPPGVPSFVDPPANNRPANGVHPHNGERPGGPHDPFGGPGGPHDPFGAPGGHQDRFGPPPNGHHDPFGGPGGAPGDPFGGAAGGRASVGVPGQGPMGEPGGFPPAFPPPPQQAAPGWPQAGPGGEPEQGRFEAFRPEAEPKTEAPTPKVRNGRVLAVVLIAAVLILAVPLGLLTLLGKIGGDDKPAGFDPAVGSCVKQSGATAVPADCGEQGAFTVVSRVDSKDKCADPAQPQVVLPGDGANRVLCLKPAGQ
ncbi:LppU/SCO3897 family protein [Micromonospora sp. I033]